MSQTYSIVCPSTKGKVWVGQGWGEMTTFYSGDAEAMENLANFLRRNEGRPLYFLRDQIYKKSDMRIKITLAIINIFASILGWITLGLTIGNENWEASGCAFAVGCFGFSLSAIIVSSIVNNSKILIRPEN